MTIATDISGQRFGRLVALSRSGSKNGRALWVFSCDCGNEHVAQAKLVCSGTTRSCGCLVLETRTKHGLTGTRLYRVWSGMVQRCTNPNNEVFHLYGGRGISIHEPWLTFAAFAEWALSNGYRDTLEIDREDNESGYAPENCRFVTRKINARNTRRNRFINVFGHQITIAEACEAYRIHPATLLNRLDKQCLSPEEAVTRPTGR